MPFSPSSSLSADALWNWGRAALWVVLGLGGSLVLWLVWSRPDFLIYLPILLIGGIATVWLFQHPLVNLTIVLLGYVVISGKAEGIQATEVLYGLYYLAFVTYWFTTRLMFYRAPLVYHSEDRALLLLLAYGTASVILTLLFGGRLSDFRGEWVALTFYALYFPVREACLKHQRYVYVVAGILTWIVAFAAVRNFLDYQQRIMMATQAWQVLKGRVVINEMTLMFGSIGLVTFLVYAHTWRMRLSLLGTFAIAFGGLLLTQGRVAWLSFLLGCFLLFLLTDRHRKGRLLLLAVAGGAFLLALALVLIPDFLSLIIAGITSRFTSLSGAGQDISLINRLAESEAVWNRITLNPLLGYGLGASYSAYDLIYQATTHRVYVHNGYLYMWYGLGLVGLGLLLFWWFRVIRRSFIFFRSSLNDSFERTLALVVVCCFAVQLFYTLTSNPLAHREGPLMMGVLAGAVSGCWLRARGLDQRLS